MPPDIEINSKQGKGKQKTIGVKKNLVPNLLA